MLTPDERRLTERHGIEPVVRAVGCPECGFTGYRGRLPVIEVLVAGPRFQQAVEQRKGWATLTRVAQQGGMRPMHRWVWSGSTQGKTTLVEVERVLGQQVEEEVTARSQGAAPHPPGGRRRGGAAAHAHDPGEGRLRGADEADDGQQALDILKSDPDFPW